jgi:hypothetical protein
MLILTALMPALPISIGDEFTGLSLTPVEREIKDILTWGPHIFSIFVTDLGDFLHVS